MRLSEAKIKQAIVHPKKWSVRRLCCTLPTVTVRSSDRSRIAKLRRKDYERTLKRRKN